MFLAGADLKTWGERAITGGDPRYQPASIDLTLGRGLFVNLPNMVAIASHPEVSQGNSHRWEPEMAEDVVYLRPRTFALGTTAESVIIGHNQCGQVHGKSTLGRNGLLVHVTAGLLDPGFVGQITLELYNVSEAPLVLEVGQPICQIQIAQLNVFTDGYQGHYQNQKGTTKPWN
jgi:dCTP deaminase